jgi:hypothetical protein
MVGRLLSILALASICVGLSFAPSSTADDRGLRRKAETPAPAGDRVTLIIGNAVYKHVTPLHHNSVSLLPRCPSPDRRVGLE